ncbi:NAD(P)/FAD-dependent oxidoreductase [Thalassotalea sp. PLHSN55]|uniref:NAD(P)/FAD-dependent oxidoreductase n=1 Tax=Thalassotalea sp. PLHSN55 TaxID=3435888 RepID=UPI003F84BF6A
MKNIAVIGTGISGLTAAYLLAKKHNVTVFEKSDRIGGHTATVDVQLKGQDYAIDTGFIVFNNRTYPNYLALLAELGIGKQETQMSFSVHNCQTGLEYNGHSLSSLFAQKRNIFRWQFWRLIADILRFNKLCKQAFSRNNFSDNFTLADFLAKHKFNQFFAQHYILPMGAAIWSCSLDEMAGFQFQFFVRFFHHHGLLNIKDRPQWYVIPNGSRSYLAPLTQSFAEHIQTNANIVFITRENDKVQLHFDNSAMQEFDEVVIACHSDQALALLKDASDDEKRVLSAMPYSANSVVLHTDTALLPKRKKAWASWNYQLSADRTKPASVTYNMNILQGMKSDDTFCVTLNQADDIETDKILARFTYHHPMFSVNSMKAQQQRKTICGHRQTHFAGAYWYSGFHEDGVRSAVDVAARFNCYLKQFAKACPDKTKETVPDANQNNQVKQAETSHAS